MIIRIDDSVFTVDENEAYTVLRLIKKVLIPKQESFQSDVDSAVAKSNEALNKAAANSEAIEAIEDELESINETKIPNLQDELNSVGASVDMVGSQVTVIQGDVEHILTEDIPMLNNDLISIGQSLNNKLDKFTPNTQGWKVVYSTDNGGSWQEETVNVNVAVVQLGKLKLFRCSMFPAPSLDVTGNVCWGIKIPDNISGIPCVYGTIALAGQLWCNIINHPFEINKNILVCNTTTYWSTSTGFKRSASFGGSSTNIDFFGWYIEED